MYIMYTYNIYIYIYTHYMYYVYRMCNVMYISNEYA